MGKLTYKSAGVNYDKLDVLKREAQISARETFGSLPKTFLENRDAQGESAFILDVKNQPFAFAFVQEGLGTKNLVADAMMKYSSDVTYYDAIAQDTVATIVNDIITVGARPMSITAYWAIGSEIWLENKKRRDDLVKGWKMACKISGAAWSGGETPILSGIIEEHTIDLAGAAFGVIVDKKNHLTLGQNLSAGDAIVFLTSSGIHANGLTLARKLAERIPGGYLANIGNGEKYGEALLTPTYIYAKVIEGIFEKGISIHYMAHITGHGWRKIMRYNKKDFTYRITQIPQIPQVLQFIQQEAELDSTEAYGTLNMGAGFAIFVPEKHVKEVIAIAKKQKITAMLAGYVEKGKRQVIIEPKNTIFAAESLQVRV